MITVTNYRCPICQEETELTKEQKERAECINTVPKICHKCRDAILIVRRYMENMHITFEWGNNTGK